MLSSPSTTMRTDLAILAMLQITDSLFPTGSFTQSYGVETYVQEGLINSKETLAGFLKTYLEELATSDCLASTLAYRAAENKDIETIFKLDQILAAQKLARESRQASSKTGIRMLKMGMTLFPGYSLERFYDQITQGKAYGHYPIVFGLVAQICGLGPKEAALAFVYNTIAGLVNNAVRLIPLGQIDGQGVLVSLQTSMLETAEKSQDLEIEDLGSFLPGLEIRSMQHERLYSRLFMS
ncbi:MAG: urease accessory protein UreF [Desulfitobacteriaceae bacterium]